LSASPASLIAVIVLGLGGLCSVIAALRTDLPWPRWRVAGLVFCRLLILGMIGAWCLALRFVSQAETDRVELVVVADCSASLSADGRKTVDDWIARARALAERAAGSMQIIELGSDNRRTSGIAEALDAARSTLTGRGEKRILLLSDGRATTRDPLAAAARLRREGIKVYAVPAAPLVGESLVDSLAVPAAAWRSVPLPVEVTLRASAPGPCKLTLLVDGERKQEQEARLDRGLTVVEMTAAFDTDGIHQVEVRAEFAHDKLDWNNAAAALLDVPLAPRVIIVSQTPAPVHPLKAALAANGFQVRVVSPNHLPARSSCDCIVLDNVPAKALGEARLKAIEGFVRDGGAVVFAGGPQAYGAGGYRGTALEPVFPVLLEPKKEYPPFALAVVLDNSWSMNEGLTSAVGKIDIAKEIAIAAMEGLKKGDWLTLVSFDSDYHNIIPPTKVKDLQPARYEVSRINAFGMTNILGGLEEAARILKSTDAAYKHILLISDGKETETGTDYSHLLASLERTRVTLSTIGVGLSPNARLLNTLAYAGKGRYLHAKSVKEIPAVVLQEAKSLEDQLTVEIPLPAKMLEEDPALAGIEVAALPRLLGYNRSRARTHAWTPLVISRKAEPLLARMRYGRGQALAFLSSVTSRWAKDWIEKKPAEYVAFWRQAVASVLGPPHRRLGPTIGYEQGWPVFGFPGLTSRGSQNLREVNVSRLAGGQVSSAPAGPGPIRLAGADTEALLVTAEGRSNKAFSWSRSYGRELADPAKGLETLRALCRETGGVFQPRPEALFAGGRATVRSEINPTTWLIAAVALLIVELLLRRLPAVAGLFKRVRRHPAAKGMLGAALLCLASQARAMEVSRQGSRLIVTGASFRYTWDSRRGGELAQVEQRGLTSGGWWTRGMPGRRPSTWQRVNSTFAWKSLDTIPALSFSTKRLAYYSGEWTIAYANADRTAKIRVLKQSRDEVVFETESAPRILENLRLPVPWRVRQRIRVFDSGVVLTRIEIRLPEGEVYELDWASMSVNLDDWLYKEPSPDKQARFVYGWAFPGESEHQFNSYKPVLQGLKHLPLDIDVRIEDTILTGKPLLYGSAAYDLTHVKGSAQSGYAECCLAEARSLVGTRAGFGSHIMIRPQSGMSPVPTYAGSMRNRPCFGVSWNLFDGETRGLNEPLTYVNTLTFAVGSRKRSSRPDAPADDRNVLIAARIYYARDRLPSADEVKAMAAEGCDTLILGPAWRGEAGTTAGIVKAAHAAGMRVGATVDVKELKTLVKDGGWFTQRFQPGRDGLFLTNVSFLGDAAPEGELEALGERTSFKYDGPFRANAAPFAICMRALRRIVGERGFLIGDPGSFEPTLLSLAEFDLHATDALDPYRWGSPQQRCFRRYRAGAGFGPVLDSLSPQWMALGAIHADTPIVLWPPKDKKHLPWWQLCRRLPPGGSRIESDLIAAERRFTTTSPHVHGTLFDGGKGRLILLLAAEKDGAAKVRLALPARSVKSLDGKPVPLSGGVFDAGSFSAWQVKGLVIAARKKAGR